MPSTEEDVGRIVLAQLKVLYKVPFDPNNRAEKHLYSELMASYMGHLKCWDRDVLAEGMDRLVATHFSRAWPSVAEINQCCMEVERERRERYREQMRLLGPNTRQGLTLAEKRRNKWKLQVLGEWKRSGRLYGENEAMIYTDLLAEAARRQERAGE